MSASRPLPAQPKRALARRAPRSYDLPDHRLRSILAGDIGWGSYGSVSVIATWLLLFSVRCLLDPVAPRPRSHVPAGYAFLKGNRPNAARLDDLLALRRVSFKYVRVPNIPRHTGLHRMTQGLGVSYEQLVVLAAPTRITGLAWQDTIAYNFDDCLQL